MATRALRRALTALAFVSACAPAATIDIATDGTTSWKVSVPSQGISNATPHTGYIANSITPFSGAGNCTNPSCYDTFDGFWTATLSFTLPSNATSVALDFSTLTADDRGVLELNGVIIGDAYSGSAPDPATGNMTLTDGGPNNPYNFGGAASESGDIVSGFDIGGSNTLTLIVNNTQVGAGGSPTGTGFTAAGVAGSVTYSQATSGPGTAIPEPAPALPVIVGITAMLLLSYSRRVAP